MLKWQGDFTLPRLRAKLASKYRLHPDVEPEYGELYRPDLSQTVINRKDSFSSLGDAGKQMTSTWSGTSRTPTSLSSSGSGRELPFSQRQPRRVASVPNLGTRRAVVGPAARQPLPPGLHLDISPSARARAAEVAAAAIAAEAVPPPPADDLKAIAKEEAAELASRRFWNAADGNQHYLLEELSHIKSEDPPPTNQAIMARLKGSQACSQMNKARKEGARIDWRNQEWDGATLLLKAVRTGSMALAMHLIAIGADPMMADFSGRGLLHWLAIEGNAEMANYVFDTVPDLQTDVADKGGDTPLHLAAYHGHLPIVRLLVRAGVEVSRENAGGFTAYQLAEAKRMWHVTTYLAEYRLQQEDVANKETMQIKDLLRPCNVHRANQVRLDWADRPKAK